MILDTNAISALFDADPALGAILESSERHELPAIVIGEYRFGLIRSTKRRSLEGLLAELIAEMRVLSVDAETAKAYSTIRDELRRAGRPIPENDIWIAALARQYGLALVSRDGHFDDVPGLRRLSW